MINIDNQDNMALNEQVEAENNLDTTPVAEQQTVGDVSTTEGAPEEVQTETTRDNPKKGFQARVQELDHRAKAAEEQVKSLQQKVAELTTPQAGFTPPQVPFNPQEPIVAPGEEIDVNELNRRIQARENRLLQQMDARSELRQRQAEAVSRINSETNDVVRLYPELDPESNDYNSELSETIAEATEAYIKSNPYDASVKTFVGKLMKASKGAVSKEVGKATENIAKQVSQAALRPTSVRQAEKTAGEKSIAELEAELEMVYS